MPRGRVEADRAVPFMIKDIHVAFAHFLGIHSSAHPSSMRKSDSLINCDEAHSILTLRAAQQLFSSLFPASGIALSTLVPCPRTILLAIPMVPNFLESRYEPNLYRVCHRRSGLASMRASRSSLLYRDNRPAWHRIDTTYGLCTLV